MFADKIGMCLTIPKKVISIDGENIVVENPAGIRQNVKSIVNLSVGDYCLTQQGIAIEKIEKQQAEEALKFLKEGTL
jgi:hydrogenase expression/formation protein HypC